MRRASVLLVIAALFLAPAVAFAAEPFTANLSGDAETPPVDTDATGTANVTISDDESSIDFEVTFDGLSDGTATMAHIHYGPNPDEAGPVMIWLTEVGVTDGTFSSPISGTATEAQFMAVDGGPQNFAEALDAIRDGDTYVNVHTAMHPGGEIRGQLMAADDGGTPPPSSPAPSPGDGGALPPTDTADREPFAGLPWMALIAVSALAVLLVTTRRLLGRLG